jgi:hypothetical protein
MKASEYFYRNGNDNMFKSTRKIVEEMDKRFIDKKEKK